MEFQNSSQLRHPTLLNCPYRHRLTRNLLRAHDDHKLSQRRKEFNLPLPSRNTFDNLWRLSKVDQRPLLGPSSGFQSKTILESLGPLSLRGKSVIPNSPGPIPFNYTAGNCAGVAMGEVARPRSREYHGSR